jgi:hypothetical protein
MSYFDDASLVMIPSGYKNAKVYSVKPTDGTGDLTFSRASSATRVQSDGLIEKVRENLILQSQDFTTTWAATSATVTANTTANPLNGVVNADTITLTGATTQKYVAQAFVLNGTYTTSVYLKAGTHQFVQLMLGTDPTPFANFDLVNGTASATSSTATIVAAGGGWYRCSMSFTSVLGTTVFITAADSLATPRFQPTASTGTYIAFGYQLETGDIATDYIATTTAAVSVGPVSGLPRLDYLGSTCPRLLLEPQRTNLALYSEQLNNAEYTADNASFTANAAASPDGYTNADLLTENSSAATHGFYAPVVGRGTTGANLTTSIFAKSNGRRYINISGGFDSSNYYNAVFDLQNGVVSTTGNSGAGTSPVASIVSYGNGWYRCIVTGSVTGLPNRLSFIYLSNSTTGNGVGGATYTGNGTSGAYFYGFQIEEASYATSYIPTLGASVTRVADAASKTGITSLIGQTEGTLFLEISTLANDGVAKAISLSDNSNANIIEFAYFGNNQYNFIVRRAGGATYNFAATLTNVTAMTKFAFSYKQNDFALYINGSQINVFTSGNVPISLDTFKTALGDSSLPFDGKVSQVLLFKTRLTNAQLAELTA